MTDLMLQIISLLSAVASQWLIRGDLGDADPLEESILLYLYFTLPVPTRTDIGHFTMNAL